MDLLKARPANSSPLTPLSFLNRCATVYGDCLSIIYEDTTYTWSQTFRRCLSLASSLASLGIKRADVVSVVSPNTPAMYELQFAVPMCGAVLSNTNTRLDSQTISVLLQHSGSTLVFVDYEYKKLVLDAISLYPLECKVAPPRVVFIEDWDHKEVKDSQQSPNLDYEEMIKMGDPEFEWIRPKSEWDPMVLNYTSGTTSAPKGVVHSHRGLYIVAMNTLVDWSMPNQLVYLWTLPIFHANGWGIPWGLAAIGATNICIRKFNSPGIYSLIRKHGVTHMCGAPIVLNMLANVANEKPLAHSVHILTAGAPPPASVLFQIESLGFNVSHGYGLTETAGLVVSCAWKSKWNQFPASERAKLKARQGVITAAMTEMNVVDDCGMSVKQDGITLGEVVLRGGSIMLGYFKDPIQTENCMKEDGWLYTGDVGVIHPDGYLEIKDRSKDIIISGGENISSVQVESVLYSHPLINEAAVVARVDKFWGETPCAFISLKSISNRPTEKEIIEFCRARLPHFMVPKTVVFKQEIPKTSTGKIQKFVLRDMTKDLDPLLSGA